MRIPLPGPRVQKLAASVRKACPNATGSSQQATDAGFAYHELNTPSRSNSPTGSLLGLVLLWALPVRIQPGTKHPLKRVP